jgi:hypothetical protein
MEHDEKHPAQPEQQDSFEKGLDHKPDPPEEDLEPDYARGLREGEPAEEEEGRFSEGAEDLPDSPEKHVERRFSEGVERSPTSE